MFFAACLLCTALLGTSGALPAHAYPTYKSPTAARRLRRRHYDDTNLNLPAGVFSSASRRSSILLETNARSGSSIPALPAGGGTANLNAADAVAQATEFPQCATLTKLFAGGVATPTVLCAPGGDKFPCGSVIGPSPLFAPMAAKCDAAVGVFEQTCRGEGKEYMTKSPGNLKVGRLMAVAVGACPGTLPIPTPPPSIGVSSSGSGSDGMVPCPAGKRKRKASDAFSKPNSDPGASDDCCCVLCEAGKFQDEVGKSGCKNCPPGRFAKEGDVAKGNSGNSLCMSCPPGKTGGGSKPCAKCSTGQVSLLTRIRCTKVQLYQMCGYVCK